MQLLWLIVSIIIHANGKLYYPFTDSDNLEGWTVFEPMTDEFESNILNSSKWYNYNPGWKGRQPGLFQQSNVRLYNGTLQLWATYDDPVYEPFDGYHNYSTSAVTSVSVGLLYGYVEIKAKLGSSKISSAFWFNSNPDGNWTEIDVFEESGPINQTQYLYGQYHENTHINTLNGIPNSQFPTLCNCTADEPNNMSISPCSAGASFIVPFHDFASDWHIYGMNWTESRIITYLDGKTMRDIPNYCFKYSYRLLFDRETMPDWLGLPNPSDLPDQPYQIEYVRAWQQL